MAVLVQVAGALPTVVLLLADRLKAAGCQAAPFQ